MSFISSSKGLLCQDGTWTLEKRLAWKLSDNRAMMKIEEIRELVPDAEVLLV